MGLITWIKSFLDGDSPASREVTTEEFLNVITETRIRELAFHSCVNMIANSISKCEFKTYKDGKEIKSNEYYAWNVEPNKNQNSSQYIHKLIFQLYNKNECLVIEQGGQLLVADSFQKTEYALYDFVFDNVTVNNFTFPGKFNMSDVMYFKLSEGNMRQILNGIFEGYGALIAYAMKSYKKSRGNKGVLDYEAFGGNEVAKQNFEDLMNNRFKTFFNAENAVLPLQKGYTYTDIGSKTYSNEGTRDIREMINDIADFTAKGFGIPAALAKGDVAGTKDAVDSYLTFCIDPLVDMISEEINRKRYGLKEFLKGNYIKIDTKSIIHVDLLSVSSSIDKLISSGGFCINDIRKLVGENEIDEPWAWQHFITKNYSTVQDLLEGLGGDPVV